MHKLVALLLLLSLSAAAQELIFKDGFENRAPVITSSPETTGLLGELYAYDVEATDPDGDTLMYLLTTAPGGMAINAATGEISWSMNSEGIFPVEIDVSDGEGGNAVQSWSITVTDVDTDEDGLSDSYEAVYGTDPEDPDSDDDGLLDGEEVFTYLTDPLYPDSDRDDLIDGEEVNTYGTDPADVDTDGDGFGDGLEIDAGTDPLDENDFPEGPPDPDAVAPPIDETIATTVFDSARFLFMGNPPIQTGVTEGIIKPERAAVLRGHVMDREGAHLPGAVISIKDHPEFGQTISRVDGMFDMVVNGGGLLTINYTAEGSLPAQRQLEVPWQDYIQVPDVVMISLDSNVTLFDLDAGTMAVAQGSEITDGDGTRQATLMCPPGTTAELVFPDGSTQAVNTLNIRATEYTVGELGPQMMPAMLPPTSAYTYAVELSADEALSAGATDVQFSQPLPFYVENFLDFPVGMAVPTGYYDRSRSAWVASDNGLVIEIVGETTGLADVDLDGDGIADTGQNLADLGITDDERENLATLYEPLQSLWRVPIAHFTPWDHNWAYSQPDDAKPPRVDDPEQDNGLDKKVKVKCTDKSSIIECQSQVLGEKMAVIGTPFRLNYRSDRMPGYAAARSARFFLSNETVPASLKRIELNYSIAGQPHKLLFPPEPEQSTTIFWDGMDVYGRKLGGSSSFSASIDYIYDAVYRAPSELQRVFAELGDTSILSSRDNMEVALSQRITAGITVLGAGSLASRFQGLGGWTLDPHHVYDVNGRTLLKGSGQQRRVTSISRVAYTLLDADTPVVNAPAGLNIPRDMAVGANGSIFIVDSAMHRVLRRSADGTLESFAGTGEYGFNGDGGPATAAQLARPFAVALGPDGSLYIADKDNYRIRRVDLTGTITTVAGTGTWGFSGDNGPATLAQISEVKGIAIASDGSIYVADEDNDRVRRITPGGIIRTIAGPGTPGVSGDGGLATQAEIWSPQGILIGPDGSVYVSEARTHRVRRIFPDGTITTVAGTGEDGFSGDNGPATAAQLYGPTTMAFGPGGALYIADSFNNRIRRIDLGGIITTFAGNSESGCFDDKVPLSVEEFDAPLAIAFLPMGEFLVTDFCGRVRVIDSEFPAFDGTDVLITSEDGSQLYNFDLSGKHLRTLSTLTGAVLFEFGYGGGGFLSTITDATSNVTSIQRDSSGQPTAIIGPFGQTTLLSINANGYLSRVTNPAGETFGMTYSSSGLLRLLFDPLLRETTYSYDASGRLISATDPAGGTQTLERTAINDGFQVTHTSTGGRQTTYIVEELPDGSVRTRSTNPFGAIEEVTRNPDGRLVRVDSDGEVVVEQTGLDSRFGAQSTLVVEQEFTSPNGLNTQVIRSQTTVLSDPDDALSMESQLTEVQINGRSFTSSLDVASLTYTSMTPEGRIATQRFDTLERLVETQYDPALSPKQANYGPGGRITQTTFGTQSVDFTYDALGRLISRSNALGEQTQFEYDDANRYSALILPSGRRYDYTYDAVGNRTSVKMPSGAIHALAYSLLGQETTYMPPGNSVALNSEYDTDRKYSATVHPSGRRVDYLKDTNGRAVGIGYPEADIAVTYPNVTSDRVDIMTRTPAGGGTAQDLLFTYDGSIITGMTNAGSANGAYTFSYNDNLFLEGISLDGGPPLVIASDNDGLVTGIGPYSISRLGPAGAPNNISDGTLSIDFTFNNEARLTQRTHAAGVITAYDLQFSHDAAGRIIRKIETVDGVTHVYDFDFDLDGQLIEVREDSVIVEEYAFDMNGNRTLRAVRGGSETSTYDAQDRIIAHDGLTYTVNDDGFLAQRGTSTFAYSARGELLSVGIQGEGVVTYAYDGFNRMVARTDDVGTTQYLYGDPNNPVIVTEVRNPNSILTSYVYDSAGVLYAMERDGTRYYVGSDQVGTPRIVFDSSGSAIKIIEYDAWGVILNDSNPGFELHIGFAGGIIDPDTNMLRFGLRDYDPLTGRWTARDPVLYQGGQANLYAYVDNDPVNYRDPTGLGICIGGSIYRIFGGGATFCFDEQGTSLCLEVGLGVGGGPTFNLNGKIADVDGGGADYVEAKFGIKCGPISFGASTKLDDCGKWTVDCPAALPFGSAYNPCAGNEVINNDGYHFTGPTKAGVTGSLKRPGLKQIIGTPSKFSSPPIRKPEGTRVADPECKAEASAKGVVCGRHKW